MLAFVMCNVIVTSIARFVIPLDIPLTEMSGPHESLWRGGEGSGLIGA